MDGIDPSQVAEKLAHAERRPTVTGVSCTGAATLDQVRYEPIY